MQPVYLRKLSQSVHLTDAAHQKSEASSDAKMPFARHTHLDFSTEAALNGMAASAVIQQSPGIASCGPEMPSNGLERVRERRCAASSEKRSSESDSLHAGKCRRNEAW